jgi:mannosyltransferase
VRRNDGTLCRSGIGHWWALPPGDIIRILVSKTTAVWAEVEEAPVPLSSRFSADVMPVVLVMLVGAALRICGIGANSLWTDELFSRWYPELFGMRFMWSDGFTQEPNPPGYYTILKGWMWLFGTSDAALRALSALASTLAIPVVYCLGRELFDGDPRADGRRVALTGAAIFAVLPMQMHFAQEARTYALLMLPAGGILLAMARLLAEASSVRAPSTRAPASMRTLALYGFCGIVSLYLHATAALLLAAASGVVLVQLLWRRCTVRAAQFVATNLVIVVVAAPALLGMASKTHTGIGLEWIPPLRARDVAAAISAVVTGPDASLRFPGALLTAAALGAIAVSLVRERPAPRPAIVLLGVPALFLTLACLLSLRQPILLPRIMCWVDVPFALISGYALCSPSWRVPAFGLGAALAGGLLVFFLFAPGKEPWRLLGQRFAAELAKAELVVLAPHTGPGGLASYAGLPPGLRHWLAGTPNIETGAMVARFGVEQISGSAVESAVRAGANVMLIHRAADDVAVAALLHDVPPPIVRMRGECGDQVCLTLLEWPARQELNGNASWLRPEHRASWIFLQASQQTC